MLKDFKAFIMRGNVLDLAVAVIIGASFGKIITSFVNDIVMPPIGLILGKVDFNNLYINLSDGSYPSLKAAQDAGAATINYGVFINSVITFIVIAFVVFLIARSMIPKAAPTKFCSFCGEEILASATRCRYCTSQLSTPEARRA